MTDFLAPWALALLVAIVALVVARAWLLRRRKPALRYSSLSLVREAVGGSSRVRRHLPFALFALGLVSLVVALARPVQVVNVPAGRTTVILAMDVSRSMCATDIQPNRLLAAESAASSFIGRQSDSTQIGIVAFAGFAEVVQTPTTDQEVLLDVIDSLTTGRRTAIGGGDPRIARRDLRGRRERRARPARCQPVDRCSQPQLPRGAYAPAIIVLLTDGASNAGPLPVDAASEAAARGVRVYTIGFGTNDPNSERPPCGIQFLGNEPNDPFGFGGFGGGGTGFRRAIDEQTLMAVADATGGEYYPAASADELQKVFANLPTNLITKPEIVEVSVLFVALGAVLVALGILLGQAWRPLP